jgi:uncharacterized protein involved in exopolysaccharide biosynthesis
MGLPEKLELHGEGRFSGAAPSIAALLIPLVRSWKAVVAIPAAVGLVTAGISSVIPPTFTATTTFTAEASSGSLLPGNLADLAGRFGLPSGRISMSRPDFFADVLTSKEILLATLQTPFSDDRFSPPMQRQLLEILRVKGKIPTERIEKGVRKLEKRVSASFSTRTDIVTLNVDAPTAQLAADVANRMVQLLDSFNVVRRQYQSRELRRFAGERLDDARRELQAVEDSSLRFLQANRRFSDSPVLLFEAKRLERQVDLRQEIVLTLAREYEEAKIAEHRDVPLLSIIDRARPPYKKSAPKVLLYSVIGVFASGMLVVLFTYARAMWSSEAREDPASHEALARAWRSLPVPSDRR